MPLKTLSSGSLWVWLIAKQLSDISASLNTIVVSLYALTLFDNPAVLGLILALKMAGSVLGAFLVPLISRRWDQRKILIGSDFANAGLMLVLAATPTAAHHALILILPAFMGLFQGTFHVALYSQSHHFLGVERRHRMNNILAAMDGVAVVTGGILASVIYGLMSVQSIFIIDAATFLLSGLAFIQFRGGKTPEREASTSTRHSTLKGLSASGFRAILATVGLIFAARFIEAFGSATHNVGFPIMSAAYDPQNHAFLVGWTMAIWGLGKIAATIATPVIVMSLDRQRIAEDHMFIGFLMLTFMFFMGVFFADALWLILAFAFLAGLFDASTETVYYAILQRAGVMRTDQLVSLSYLVERLGMGLGIVLVGYAFSVASVREVAGLFYSGSIAICAGLLALSLFVWRRTETEQIVDSKQEQFWRDLEPLIFDQERLDRADDECSMVLAALDINEKARILDAGCGLGRHAHRFALLGHHVEGIDAVTYLIERARSQIPRGSRSPHFHVGDTARFAGYTAPTFDCAVSLYHSFGYGDDAEDDARTLSRLHELLRPGGKLFLELIDPDGFVPGQILDLRTPIGRDVYDERIEISEDRGTYVLSIRKRSADRLVYRASHRLFSRDAIANLLAKAGFRIIWPNPEMLISYPGGSRKFCVIGERGN